MLTGEYGAILAPDYDAAPLKMPVPSTGILNSEGICVRIDQAWVPYLTGILDRLKWPDCWAGTQNELNFAFDQIENLMGALQVGEDCGTVTDAITDIRLDATCGMLQVKINDVWVDKLGVEEFAPAEYVSEAYYGTGDNLLTVTTKTRAGCVPSSDTQQYTLPPQGAPGADGADGADGAQGLQGIQGDTGDPGQDGADGDCDCADTSAPPTIPTADDACGMATYILNWHDNIFQDFIDQVDLAADVTAAITAFLPLIPGVGTIAQVLVDAATNAISSTASALRADVPSTKIEEWLCNLYCTLEPLQEFDITIFRQWIALERATETALGAQVFLDTLNAYTTTELTRRAVIGAATPSTACASLCECDNEPTGCDEYDFSTGDQGWVNRNSQTIYSSGAWRLNTGQNQDNVQIGLLTVAGTVTRVIVYASDTASTNRLYIGRNALGSQQASGSQSVYDITLGTPLVMDGVDDYLWVSLDWAPGLNSTHPQNITRVDVCFAE